MDQWYFTCDEDRNHDSILLLCGHFLGAKEIIESSEHCLSLVNDGSVSPNYTKNFACNLCETPILTLRFGDLLTTRLKTCVLQSIIATDGIIYWRSVSASVL